MKTYFGIFILGLLVCSGCSANEKPEPGRCSVNAQCEEGFTCRNTYCEDIYYPEREVKPY